MAVNFEIPYKSIKVGDGDFTVRGMNSEEIVFLTQFYLNDVVAAVAKHGKRNRVERSQLADLVMDVAKDFPSMCAEIISRCADAQDEVAKFRALPFATSIKALKAIIELTVDDGAAADLKNVAAGLVKLLEVNGLQLGPLSKQLQTIIRTSGNQSPS